MTPSKQTITADHWDEKKARHLLNRAGFGIPFSAIEKLEVAGPEASVALLVDYEKRPADWTPPGFLSNRDAVRGQMAMSKELPEAERRKNRQAFQRQSRQEMTELKSWWIQKMRTTKRPLEEKMTLFWHGHFATSAQDVKLPVANWELNQIFREHATGNFKTLVIEVGKSHAMMEYLDNRRNRKDHPNENWARELLELFTLGIGSYTEDDIKEAARAFTGYTNRDGNFIFQARQHDEGEKTFLGESGNLDAEDIFRIIFKQSKCSQFITGKLLRYFMTESPDQASIDYFAEVLYQNDYELKPFLCALFLSEEFYTEKVMGTQIKSPAQYMVMLTDQLRLNDQTNLLVTLGMRAMEQDLFYPPNVKGWDGNRDWINTNTLLTRYNVPAYLFAGERPQRVTTLRLDEVARSEKMSGDKKGKAAKRLDKLPKDRVKQVIARRLGLDLKKLMKPLDGLTAQQAVGRIEKYFLSRPLSDDQHQYLVRAFGKKVTPSTKLHIESMGFDDLAGPLHLILATAEYQLC